MPVLRSSRQAGVGDRSAVTDERRGAPARVGLLDLLALACELAALALLAAAGWSLGETVALSLLLAVALVGVAGWVWGRWMAPTSSHRLAPVPRTFAKVAFYLAVAGIGVVVGLWIWAVLLLAVALLVQVSRPEE
ncbi:uncharacterized protein DUF2568 [Mumia flava]|uniref:Uncharacterized protein DUF2568 n=1 Tax=Mumia flava TaxID=1348852 RepID=A0A2M9BGT6_9ACTN|nr:DUF2568 domain-containing protein [Mumia flava]PJJ57124.1 uncharacterized protein DUF2568 [Mumia flava]